MMESTCMRAPQKMFDRDKWSARQITDMFKFWGGKLGCFGDVEGWEWNIIVDTAPRLNIFNFTGLCVWSTSIHKGLQCLINALIILKWYGRDFVVYASNLILQSWKLYFTSKFVKITCIPVFFVCNWKLISGITSRANPYDHSGRHSIWLVQMFCNKKAQSSTGMVK